MDLEMVILSEVSQRKKNIKQRHLYVASKKNYTNETIYKTEIDSYIESKLMVTKMEKGEGIN